MIDILDWYGGLRKKLERSWEGDYTRKEVEDRRGLVVSEVAKALKNLQGLVTDTREDADGQIERARLVGKALYREKDDSMAKSAQILSSEPWWWKMRCIAKWFNLTALSDIQLEKLTYNLYLVERTSENIFLVKDQLVRLSTTLEGFDESIMAARSNQLTVAMFDLSVEELLEGFGLRLNRSRIAIGRLELPSSEEWGR